jgi:SAM-dependent methyltransferase
LAEALLAYHRGDLGATLLVHTDLAEAEAMPVSVFFREGPDLRGADRAALDLVRGRILDAGAGVGSISLLLQQRGFPVTATEILPEAVEIMKDRGVRDPFLGSVVRLPLDRTFDTILLLMNGAALAGTLRGFPNLLRELGGRLAPGGQVLMDSTDLGRGGEEGGRDGWCGEEVHYQLQFQQVKGAPFPQLFLGPLTMASLATPEGWEVEVAWEGEGGEYLARLTRLRHP